MLHLRRDKSAAIAVSSAYQSIDLSSRCLYFFPAPDDRQEYGVAFLGPARSCSVQLRQ